MKKVLFVQSDNTLAKLSHNLGFADALVKAGYDVIFGVSKRGSEFLSKNSLYRYQIIPQLWELSPESHFIDKWFQDKQYIRNVFESEYRFISRERPDVVISNVSYTAKLSCRKAGIPLISVIPPIQSPGKKILPILYNTQSLTPEVKEKVISHTNKWEDAWWREHARPFDDLAKYCGLAPMDDVRTLLLGDFQLIHSVVEYDKVSNECYPYKYTGPLIWGRWENSGDKLNNFKNMILCTFGTKLKTEMDLIHKTVAAVQKLKDDNFVIHAEAADNLRRQYSHIKNVSFVKSYSPEKLLPVCRAVFCQSGYGIVLLCFKYRVPMLTVPFQLEQRYHTNKLEQLGAGFSLTAVPKIDRLFNNKNSVDVFMNMVEQLTVDKIYDGLYEVIYNDKYRQGVARVSPHFKNTLGCQGITALLERQPWLNSSELHEVTRYGN